MSELSHIIDRLGEIQTDVQEVKGIAEEALTQAKLTNGTVRKHEVIFAEIRGAKRAIGWVPPMATALASSAFSVLLYSIFLAH